ncbi:Major Facilitator Superfamily protein [Caldanaerobius fijiensis DSM 17918]|uniref:Major Facilitator Superfamily protein n=1 Tax=Caldanaerobius fijiensis DSM 17918 TaxID=1121256 RepID=A0A1M5F1V2_9THEO|nr:MFS transporter [Caldanaerobius fijiensis]SHF85520.1 Major Facilitator Superfamily protein [Caldanaerobius fijiensis DSM 17918]
MFKRIKGNARGCLIYEPMWIIPASMFMTYSSLYMVKLGLSDTQIGFITSLGLVVQIFSSFISGYLTDRLGRRRALLLFDLLSWSVATLIWAISQNFWYFFVAAIINGFQKIPNTAWNCLLVEDTVPEDRPAIFTILQLISVIAGFFAPLGGLLVKRFTLVPAMRIMYLIAFVSMTFMFLGRNYATHETDIGIRKMKESAELKFKDSLKEYLDVIKEIISNKFLMVIFAVYILNNFQMTIRGTYQSMYLVQALKLDDALIAIFPTISSLAMLVLLLFVMPRLNNEHASKYMIFGFAISLIANLILVLAPPKNVLLVILSTLMASAGGIIVSPYLESSVANAIDDETRAKTFSILTVLILLFISPSGIIGGWTYSIDPRIPFILIVGTFLLCIILLWIYSRKEKPEMFLSKADKA